jgi:flagellar protein FlaC
MLLGGVWIKLKMGANDDNLKKESEEETTSSVEAEKEEVKTEEKKEEPEQDKEELRKVIKLNPPEEKKEPEPKQSEPVQEEDYEDREILEQKRAILQSIKDFDFQIKKNQEEITTINGKMDSILKDLDDLVSLYEIVSEQMNPFVGLSKVTKKRIDALENFTREMGEIRERIGDLESFAERAGGDFAEIKALRKVGSYSKDDNVSRQLENLAPEDLDEIIEKSFTELNVDQKIDLVIEEYIEDILNIK